MPVTVKYKGRFGNHLFQYVAAYLLSKRLGTKFLTPFPKNSVHLETNKKCGNSWALTLVKLLPKTIVDDLQYHSFKGSFSSFRNIQCKGYFQNSLIFNAHETEIKNLFQLKPITKNITDIVLHIRLEDFYHDSYNAEVHNGQSEIISPAWYTSILDSGIKFDKVYIVLYDKNTPKEIMEKYLSNFDKYKPVILRNRSEEEDFNFIRSFDTIVSSNSTFSWWAAFLSEASTIYIPENIGYFGVGTNQRSHGDHIKELWNIKGVSRPIPAEFCDVVKMYKEGSL